MAEAVIIIFRMLIGVNFLLVVVPFSLEQDISSAVNKAISIFFII